MENVYDSFLSNYICESREEGSKEYRAETIVTLQEYIQFVEESLEKEKEKAENFKTPDFTDVNDKAVMIIGILSYFAKEADQKLLAQYQSFAEETINITKVLANKIKHNESIEVDYEGFIKEMKRRISTNPKLVKLRFYVDALTNI